MSEEPLRDADLPGADAIPQVRQGHRSEQTNSNMRLSFAHKIMLLITILICLTGISITSGTAFHFRSEMYEREYNAAFTVYSAAASYLSGHYKSKGNTFVPQSIDFVLRNKFLHPPRETSQTITHRPSRLILYNARGHVIYDYKAERGGRRAQDLHPSLIPLAYGPLYYPEEQVIKIAGKIAPGKEVPGYLEISFPSQIQKKVKDLFLRSFLIMGGVLVVAGGLSWIFARNVLSPIEALTRAAERMRRGDLEQEVHVSSDDEIGMLATAFNTMAASISRRIALLHRIQEWTVRIGKELETQRLYSTLVAMFSLMSTSHVCRLYVRNSETNELEARFDRGGDHLPPPEEDELAQQAFAERWAKFLLGNGKPTEDPAQAMELAIPLLSGDHRIGVIRIGKNHDEVPYDDETLTILQTLAQHASVAADNAHLYEELGARERIEQEMKWARRIQQSMLPHETPAIPGYDVCGRSLPAYEVGGDYFDYIATDGSRWYFAIADVSGKGVPAALIMSIVRALLHSYIEFEKSPSDVLRKVNRKLSQDLDPEMFVTISVLCLDPENHKLYVARGGHEPTLLRRADGSLEKLEPPGAALGILDIESFEETFEGSECSVGSQDTIVLYTDGVTEARSPEDEEFGLERLEEIVMKNPELDATDLLTRIQEEVYSFAGGRMQHDDITMVVIKRSET